MLDHPRARPGGTWGGYTVPAGAAPPENIGGMLRSLRSVTESLVKEPPIHDGAREVNGRAVVEVTREFVYGPRESPSREGIAEMNAQLLEHARMHAPFDVLSLTLSAHGGDGGLTFRLVAELAQRAPVRAPHAADGHGGRPAGGALPPLVQVGTPRAGNGLNLLTTERQNAANAPMSWDDLLKRSADRVVADGLVQGLAPRLTAVLQRGAPAEVHIVCTRWDIRALNDRSPGVALAQARLLEELKAVAPTLSGVHFGITEYDSQIGRGLLPVFLTYADTK